MKNLIIITTSIALICTFSSFFYLKTKSPIYSTWKNHEIMIEKLDFDAGMIGPVKLGSDFRSIEKFGRPQNENVEETGEYRYYSSGIEISTGGGKVLGFTCVFYDYWGLGYSSGRFQLISDGNYYFLDSETTELEVVKILGEPTEQSVQKDLKILVYINDNFLYEIDILKNGKISHIHACEKAK